MILINLRSENEVATILMELGYLTSNYFCCFQVYTYFYCCVLIHTAGLRRKLVKIGVHSNPSNPPGYGPVMNLKQFGPLVLICVETNWLGS